MFPNSNLKMAFSFTVVDDIPLCLFLLYKEQFVCIQRDNLAKYDSAITKSYLGIILFVVFGAIIKSKNFLIH